MQSPNAGRESKLLRLKLEPSRKTCIVLGTLLGVCFLGGTGLYVWQSGEVAALSQQVESKEALVASGQRTANRLARTQEEYDLTRRQMRYLETSVSAGEYVPTLLRQMEALGKSVHLSVNSVRPMLEPAPKPPVDKEARKKFKPWPYDKIHIDMELRGSYANVARFMQRLTEFPKIMAVETVQVQPSVDKKIRPGQTPELIVKVKLTGFIFPNDGKPRPDGTDGVAVTRNAADGVKEPS